MTYSFLNLQKQSYTTIGCAMEVHKTLGNGFQEVIYQRALEIEMAHQGLTASREHEMEIFYKGVKIGNRRVDFFVEGKVMVELKAVIQLEDVHLAQAINYLEAYCRLRKDMRDFRFSRMEKVTLLKETFRTKRTGKARAQPVIAIRIRFAPNAVRWVRERQHYGYQGDEEQTVEGTIMLYHVNDETEIIPWVLGWGASAEVLLPKALRKSLRETALKLADMLT